MVSVAFRVHLHILNTADLGYYYRQVDAETTAFNYNKVRVDRRRGPPVLDYSVVFFTRFGVTPFADWYTVNCIFISPSLMHIYIELQCVQATLILK